MTMTPGFDVFFQLIHLGLLLLILAGFLFYRQLQHQAVAKIELRVRERELQVQRLFREMLSGSILYEVIQDATGKAINYRVLDVNAAFETMFGVKRADIVGRKLEEASPAMPDEWLDRYSQVFSSGQSEQFEAAMPALKKFFEVRVFCPAKNRLAVMIEDITRRRMTMEELGCLLLRLRRQQSAVVRIASSTGVLRGDFREIARSISEAAADALEGDSISIWLGNREDGYLRCVDRFDFEKDEHTDGMTLEIWRYPRFIEAAMMSRTIDAISAEDDPRTGELKNFYLEKFSIKALLAASVKVSGKMVGIIFVERKKAISTWMMDELRFTGELADQLANAFLQMQQKVSEDIARTRGLELEEERKTLKSILDALPSKVVLLDKNLRVRMVNESLLRGTGCRLEDVLNHQPGHALCCAHTADHADGCGYGAVCMDCPVRKTARKVQECNHGIYGIEVLVDIVSEAGDKKSVWMEVSAVPLMVDEQPHILFSLADITARRTEEHALREAADLFQSVVNAFPETVFRMDTRGVLTFVSSPVYDLLSYVPEELVGRHYGIIIKPDFMSTMDEMLTRGLSGSLIRDQEALLLRKDGATANASLNLEPLREDGAVVGIQAVFWDISARKRAEQAREDQLQHLRSMMERMPYPLYYKNNAGVCQACNAAFERFSGCAREKLLGATIYSLLTEDDALIHATEDRKLLEGGKSSVVYRSLVHWLDGRVNDVWWNNVVLTGADGKPQGIMGVVVESSVFLTDK